MEIALLPDDDRPAPGPAGPAPRRSRDAAADPGTPRLRDLRALVPLVLLDLVVGAWLARQGMRWQSFVALHGAVGAIAAAQKWLPERAVKSLRAELGERVLHLLQSRLAAGVLVVLLVVAVALSLTVTTVRVIATDVRTPVPVHGPLGAAESPRRGAREHRLVPDEATWQPVVWAVPWGRRVVFLAGRPGRRSIIVRTRPWRRGTLVYPADFEAPAVATLLPLGHLFDLFLGGGWARLVVRDAPGGLVAEDTLRSLQALQLAPLRPPLPDSAARARWATALRDQVHVDESQAASLAARWASARWVRTSRPLREQERLSIVLISSRGDTVAADTVTLNAERRDVFIRRLP